MTKYPKGSYIVREGVRRKILEELGDLRFIVAVNDQNKTNWDVAGVTSSCVEELDFFGWKVEEVKEEWRPKHKETFFYVDAASRVSSCESRPDSNYENLMLGAGNCYPTKEAAEKAAERVKKAYRGE